MYLLQTQRGQTNYFLVYCLNYKTTLQTCDHISENHSRFMAEHYVHHHLLDGLMLLCYGLFLLIETTACVGARYKD